MAKAKRKNNDKRRVAADDDDEEVTTEPRPPEEEAESEDAAECSNDKPVKPKKKQVAVEESDKDEDADVNVARGGFAALAVDDGDGGDNGDEEEDEEPAPKPSKAGRKDAKAGKARADKGKQRKGAAVEADDVEEEDEEESRPPPKAKDKKRQQPKPADADEDDEEDANAGKAAKAARAQNKKPQKRRGGAADDSDEEPAPRTSQATGRAASAWALLQDEGGLDDDGVSEEKEEAEEAERPKKPAKKEKAAAVPAPAPAPSADAKKGKDKKQKKKKGAKDDDDEEDFDALMAEAQRQNEEARRAQAAAAPAAPSPAPAPVAPAAAEKSGKKKKGQKKAGGGGDNEHEEDAEPVTTASAAEVRAEAGEEAGGGDDDDEGESEDEGGKGKKDKKKKKKKKDDKKKEDAKKKGGAGKAMLAKIAADRELKAQIELELREQAAREEEARKAAEAEEAAKEAERVRRIQQRDADRAAAVARGEKHMTAAERARKEKDQEYLRHLEAQGKVPPKIPGAPEGEVKKKKVVYANKKKGPGKKDGSVASSALDSSSNVTTPTAAAPPPLGGASAPAAWDISSSGEESDDEGDDDKAAAPSSCPAGAPAAAPPAATRPPPDTAEEPDAPAVPSARALGKQPADDIPEAAADQEPRTEYRSPICCVLGHVDTGKTSLLDKIRRTNVQGGEAGGITQQIGATFMPMEAIQAQTVKVQTKRELKHELPGLLVIDTPGHESFANLRSRGASLCDIAVLVVDIMHGLEQQTMESIDLLRKQRCPFVVALNKVDRCYGWDPPPASKQFVPIRQSLKKQKEHTVAEFNERVKEMKVEFAKQGFNSELYYENTDMRNVVSLVPTSAKTGEGIPDLLLLLVQLTQKMMAKNLILQTEPQATVLEVKVVDGLGTTIDVILVNGTLHEGDQLIVCGLEGPIHTRIKALLTPQPMREMRVKSAYQRHESITAAIGVKINAADLEKAIAGTPVVVVKPGDDVDEREQEVMQDVNSIINSIDHSGQGVYVKTSTLGAMEALLDFLAKMKVPVSGIGLGPVHLKDVKKASVMHEHNPVYACILAFNVPIPREVSALAADMNVRIFPAEIIYNLFDAFTAYMAEIQQRKKDAARQIAVFPCVIRIVSGCVFNNKNPIVIGVDVEEGILKIGTPLCVPLKGMLQLGRVISIEKNHVQFQEARKGEAVAIKIESPEHIQCGRNFEEEDMICSFITREGIDALKDFFRDEMQKDWWALIQRTLKPMFKIM